MHACMYVDFLESKNQNHWSSTLVTTITSTISILCLHMRLLLAITIIFIVVTISAMIVVTISAMNDAIAVTVYSIYSKVIKVTCKNESMYRMLSMKGSHASDADEHAPSRSSRLREPRGGASASAFWGSS